MNAPCGTGVMGYSYCNDADVTAWNSVAWDLFKRVRTAWNDTVGKGHAIPPVVKAYIESLEQDYCEAGPDGVCKVYKLPTGSWLDIQKNMSDATAIARWCSRAACSLELLDNVQGIKPPLEQTPVVEPFFPSLQGFGSFSMLALVAVAFFLLSRSGKTRRW